MSRETDEWIGATDSTPVPPRVRVRQFERDDGRCQCGCGVIIRPGMKWQTDHTVALILGGENRERNLRTLLSEHHAVKSKDDVAQKSRIYERKLSHLGIKQPSKFACGRNSPLKRKVNGQVVPR